MQEIPLCESKHCTWPRGFDIQQIKLLAMCVNETIENANQFNYYMCLSTVCVGGRLNHTTQMATWMTLVHFERWHFVFPRVRGYSNFIAIIDTSLSELLNLLPFDPIGWYNLCVWLRNPKTHFPLYPHIRKWITPCSIINDKVVTICSYD